VTFPTIHAALDHIREHLQVTERAFLEMPIGEVLARLNGQWPYHSKKWTRGEIASYVAERDSDAALEVLQCLDERGPRVVAWDDETNLFAEDDEDAVDEELGKYDAKEKEGLGR
jgi:hypothetical protein